MFRKKNNPLAEVFDDLIVVKSHINILKKEIENLSDFSEEDKSKREELEALLKEAFENRELIEEHFLREDGGIYLGSGFEIKDIKQQPKQVPVFLSKHDKSGHVGVQGTTRVGKTIGMLQNIRQNLLAKENVFVIDPKGGEVQEVLNGMIEFSYESDMLQFFFYYSLAYPDLSDMLNPFYGMGHEERASMMSIIAGIGNSEAFFASVVYQVTYAISLAFEVMEMAEDPHGKETEKLILEDIDNIKKLRGEKGYMREILDKNNNVLKVDSIDISNISTKENVALDGIIHNSTLMNFADLSKYSTFENLSELHTLLLSTNLPRNVNDQELIDRFDGIKKNAVGEIDKILAYGKDFFSRITPSLSTLLTQMSQGAMGRIFCTVRTNPLTSQLFSQNQRIVALMHPFPMKFRTISDMSSRIFMLMIDNIIGKIGASGRGLNARLNVHIDEVKAVAYPGLERTPAVAGGVGISLYFYTQSFADWEDALGSESKARTLLDNLNTQARFRMKDDNSAERVVRELDSISVISSSAMIESDGQARMVLNSEERWFAKRSDITKMAVGRCILTTGTKSYVIDTPYWSGPKGALIMPQLDFEKRLVAIKKDELPMYESYVDKLLKVQKEELLMIKENTLNNNL